VLSNLINVGVSKAGKKAKSEKKPRKTNLKGNAFYSVLPTELIYTDPAVYCLPDPRD
jgi:hypothetical protein